MKIFSRLEGLGLDYLLETKICVTILQTILLSKCNKEIKGSRDCYLCYLAKRVAEG